MVNLLVPCFFWGFSGCSKTMLNFCEGSNWFGTLITYSIVIVQCYYIWSWNLTSFIVYKKNTDTASNVSAMFSYWCPQPRNLGLKENEFTTHNYNFVVVFMCNQLVNIMFSTWLECIMNNLQLFQAVWH